MNEKARIVNLDKFMYGKTPAAIYLSDFLNSLNAPKLTRKVTRLLTEFNELVNELEASNQIGTLSAHSVGAFIPSLRARASTRPFFITDLPEDKWKDHTPSDESMDAIILVNDLTSNLMVARTKDLSRKVQAVRRDDQKNATSDYVPSKRMSEMNAELNPAALIERSRKRLARRNKVCTFY